MVPSMALHEEQPKHLSLDKSEGLAANVAAGQRFPKGQAESILAKVRK